MCDLHTGALLSAPGNTTNSCQFSLLECWLSVGNFVRRMARQLDAVRAGFREAAQEGLD